MKLQHSWQKATPLFDDEHLVSSGRAGAGDGAGRAGQAVGAARRTGPARHYAGRFGGVNPAGKVTSIIAGMAASADSIDDLQVVRSSGMKQKYAEVYASATLGQFLREFTHGHALPLASAAREHLVNLAGRTPLLPGIAQQTFIDIDSLLRPVYGQAMQGASYGHTKLAGKQVLRNGTVTVGDHDLTTTGAPVVAGIRLRAGRAGSSRSVASMITEAIGTARAARAAGKILVRGDSAYGNSLLVNACGTAGVVFSLVPTKNRAVTRAIGTIAGDAWTPVNYPGAVSTQTPVR